MSTKNERQGFLQQCLYSSTVLFVVGALLGVSVFRHFEGTRACLDPTYYRTIAQILAQASPYASKQPSAVEVKASEPLFSQLPQDYRKTYYAPCGKACHPTVRAFRELGWRKVDEPSLARVWHDAVSEDDVYKQLEPWQRYNHLPNMTTIRVFDNYMDTWRRYAASDGARRPYFLQETYRTYVAQEREAFETRISKKGGGKKLPWTMRKKRRKLDIIPANAPFFRKAIPGNAIIRQFICNPLNWSDKRSLSVRVLWWVASTNPLTVFYQDGFARIGNDMNVISDLRFTMEKVSFDAFAAYLSKYAKKRGPRKHLPEGVDAVSHVKNQFKDAISMLADAFRDVAFSMAGKHKPEDSYELFSADFVIDQDLNVWLMGVKTDTVIYDGEKESSAFVLEDYYFGLEKNHELFYGMISALEEIWDKQEQGSALLPIVNTGKWELVYSDPWKYEYEGYERPIKRRSCKTREAKEDAE